MFIKRLVFPLLALALLLWLFPASADTYYVYTENGKTLNLRSPVDNSVIGHIPYGTKLETDEHLSTEISAYVTYKGVSGYVKWEFLVKDPPKPKNGSAAQAAADPSPAQTGQGTVVIRVIGGTVSYASGGGSYTEISYDKPRKLKITADKKPAYWVINGVRYDFEPYIPASFTLDNCKASMTIEAVMKNQGSLTLLSAQAIQNARTGERLTVDAIHARLCHINAKDYGAGGWMTDFDFTDDYTNRATNKRESGGQVTVRVKATIPSGKKISYWLFDEAMLDFDTDVTQFVVRSLNTSKTYEPVFKGSTPSRDPASIAPRPAFTAAPTSSPTRDPGGLAGLPTVAPASGATPKPAATPEPSPTPKPVLITAQPAVTKAPEMYTVTCAGCTFSYGEQSGLTSAAVPAGTRLTLTANGAVEMWTVNGKKLAASRGGGPVTASSVTVIIDQNTEIQCVMK